MTSLFENLFRLATLVGREDVVGLSGGNGERTSDSCELIFIDKARVGNEPDFDSILVVADNILSPSKSVIIQ